MSTKTICAVCDTDVTDTGWCPYCNGSEPGPSPVKEISQPKCDNCFDEGCPYCRPEDFCPSCGGNISGQGGWCGYCDG